MRVGLSLCSFCFSLPKCATNPTNAQLLRNQGSWIGLETIREAWEATGETFVGSNLIFKTYSPSTVRLYRNEITGRSTIVGTTSP